MSYRIQKGGIYKLREHKQYDPLEEEITQFIKVHDLVVDSSKKEDRWHVLFSYVLADTLECTSIINHFRITSVKNFDEYFTIHKTAEEYNYITLTEEGVF